MKKELITMLKLTRVYKSYNNQVILEDINLDIKKGEAVGLVGPSGSGKSTLLRCIKGLENIDSGSIDVKGKTGFVFQDYNLFPHMTVLENITYAPQTVLKKPKTAAAVEAMDLLKSIGLDHKAQDYPSTLSGGQKQRVAFVRALAMEPDILLSDEPTAALDQSATTEVSRILNHIKSMGVTLIIASHELEFLEKVVDRMIILNNGKIIS